MSRNHIYTVRHRIRKEYANVDRRYFWGSIGLIAGASTLFIWWANLVAENLTKYHF